MELVNCETDVKDNGPLRSSSSTATAKGVVIAHSQHLGSSDHLDGISDPMLLEYGIWMRAAGEHSKTEMAAQGVKRKRKTKTKTVSVELATEEQPICKKTQTLPTNLSTSPKKHATESDTQLPPQNQEVVHICRECNIPCSSLMNLEMHYLGKKHRAKLEVLKEKDALNSKSTQIQCRVCDISCMNEKNLQEHLAGKKHAACLQAFNAASRDAKRVKLWS